jgi:hypothetical protein
MSAEIRAWFEDWQRKVLNEGRNEGGRSLLLQLLRTRFGELLAATVARIEAADMADLERWAERMLSAQTLAEVLGEPSLALPRWRSKLPVQRTTNEEDEGNAAIGEFVENYQRKLRNKTSNEGRRSMLLRLLRARFGELPAAAVARIEAANRADLEKWGERVLSAKTLAEVLDEPS